MRQWNRKKLALYVRSGCTSSHLDTENENIHTRQFIIFLKGKTLSSDVQSKKC